MATLLAGYAVGGGVALAVGLPASFLLNVAYPFVFVLFPLSALLLRRRNDAVVLEQEHLAIEGRVGPHRLAWDDVLEVGASQTSSGPLTWTPNLVVLIRPTAGPGTRRDPTCP